MAKGSKSAKAGGGPGTAVAGQVKSTMTPTFGKRGGKRGAARRGSRR